MCGRPVFRVAQESTETLKQMRTALLAKDGGPGCEDAEVLAVIRAELAARALGMTRSDGWPTALDDPKDDGLPFK